MKNMPSITLYSLTLPYFFSEHLPHTKDYYHPPPLEHNLQVYRNFTYCCIPISRQEVPGGKMRIDLSCLWNFQVEVSGRWAECMTSCLRRREWARDMKLKIISLGKRIEAEEQITPRSKGTMRREPTHKDW